MVTPTSSAARPSGRLDTPAIPARWGFWKGLLTGAAIEIPAISATVWVMSRLGLAAPGLTLMAILRLTTVFAGAAAILTAGGIGRLAAHASANGGRRRAAWVAARAHATASAGLVLIATIPHGHMPAAPLHWIPIVLVGIVPGAACGVLIGLVCGGAAPLALSDVWSIAKRPSEALGQLLSPKDLAKLGATLRTRTSTLFEGMFEPAPPPPDSQPPPPAPPPSEPPPRPKTE